MFLCPKKLPVPGHCTKPREKIHLTNSSPAGHWLSVYTKHCYKSDRHSATDRNFLLPCFIGFKKYSCNTFLCTAAIGKLNWRRTVLPQKLPLPTSGTSHNKQKRCSDTAVEKELTCNQWARKNRNGTRVPRQHNQGSVRNIFLKVLNCRDQLSKVWTVFLYLQLQYSQGDTKQVSSIYICPSES